MSKITDKQKQFCNEYLIDLNATRAYKVVYKTCKKDDTARANSSRMLTYANIKQYIEEQQKAREKRTEITQDMVLKELAAVAFANGSDFAKVVEKTYKKAIENSDGEVVGFEEVPYQDVDIVLTDELDKEKRKAISSIRQTKNGIEIRTSDKVKALELLGKHLGMFTDKLKIESAIPVVICDDMDETDE